MYDTYGKLINRTGTSDIIFGYNGKDGVVTIEFPSIDMDSLEKNPEAVLILCVAVVGIAMCLTCGFGLVLA